MRPLRIITPWLALMYGTEKSMFFLRSAVIVISARPKSHCLGPGRYMFWKLFWTYTIFFSPSALAIALAMSISMPFGTEDAGRTLLPDGSGVTFWNPGDGMLRPTVS